MSETYSKQRRGARQSSGGQQSKICPVCKLSFDNRKKWRQRGLWETVVYCSARCRNGARNQ